MAGRSDPIEALRETLAHLAAAEAPQLVAEAGAAARARARSLIEDTLVEEFLRAAVSERAAEMPAPDPRQRTVRSAAGASDPRTAREPAEPRPNGDAWWAYCVLAAADRDAVPASLPGVEPGTEVEIVQDGRLLALVSTVPLAEFGDERIREHLNDIEWVERVARAHEGVLEQVLDRATILPLRLCTLYRNRDGIHRMLREQEPMLRGTLSDLEGRREWGVKVFVDDARLAESLSYENESRHGEAAADAPSTGAEYMARRRRERKASERVHELADTVAQGIHARLEGVADRCAANPLQRPEIHGKEGQMVLNGAYLVRREREEKLSHVAASVRERWSNSGFEVELTGPWPPYNFVAPSALVAP